MVFFLTIYLLSTFQSEQQPAAAVPTSTIETLRSDLHSITSQRDSAVAELKERDARIQRLLGELQGLVSYFCMIYNFSYINIIN